MSAVLNPLPYAETRYFLDVLSNNGLLTFQTFDDSNGKRRRLSRIFQGSLGEHADALRALNDQGAGVFFMVNDGDGKGRSTKNVVAVRAQFVDLDGSPIEPVLQAPLAPHIVVESSPGRYHAYWFVNDIRLDEFTRFQTELASRFGGDPTVKDLPRVMRLPDFWHRKGEPFLTKICHLGQQPRYSRDEFLAAFNFDSAEAIPLASVPTEIAQGSRNNKLLALAAGMFRKGIPFPAVEARMRIINRERCKPPLDEQEFSALVASASRYASQGSTQVPNEVLDSPKHIALTNGGKHLLTLAYRRFNGSNNGNIALPHSEFRHLGFRDEKNFLKLRRDLVKAEFLRITREAVFKTAGHRPQAAHFALTILPGKPP